MRLLMLVLLAVGVSAGGLKEARGDDWPMLGRNQLRNAVSPEKNPPTDWLVEERDDKGALVKPGRNIKWQAKLGLVSLGGPVVANGLVWVGTNNHNPRDATFKKDASVLMCFRESDGKFLYQYVSPRLGGDIGRDWPHTSMAAPLVEGDRLWLVTNRCETLCLDIGPLKRGAGEPRLVWKVDMIRDLGVHPLSAGMALLPACSPILYKDWVYVATGNGIDYDSGKVSAPDAPSLVCFHKDTGKVVWKDNSPGKNVLEGQWSSPLVCEVKGRAQVIVAQGDGWLRSFDPATGRLLWKCDLNLKAAEWKPFGRGDRRHVVATPVLHEDRVYVGTGLGPEGGGSGALYCIDATREEDISAELEDGPGRGKPNSNAGIIWRFGGAIQPKPARGRLHHMGITWSSCVVHDGLVYAAELDGYLHCLDARTGKKYWEHDLVAGVRGSSLWVDGMVYLGADDGMLWIFPHGKDKAKAREIDMGDLIGTTPVFANGVLYVMTHRTICAIQQKK